MIHSVDAYMTKNLTVVEWSKSLSAAYSIMLNARVRHLPVVDDDGGVIGLISDRDFMRALQVEQPDFASGQAPEANFDPNSLVRDYMSWPVEAIDSEQSISQAARAMIDKKISALLVTKNQSVVGIVTTEDLLRALLVEHESIKDKVVGSVEGLMINTPIGRIAQTFADAGI